MLTERLAGAALLLLCGGLTLLSLLRDGWIVLALWAAAALVLLAVHAPGWRDERGLPQLSPPDEPRSGPREAPPP